jgi:glycosyltransferase involved in cell wall biosynthesis
MPISILMAVYAKESPSNLVDCLQSLAEQELKASEVILVEDGPIPDSLSLVIEKYRETLNIISIRLPKNLGLGAALNEGLKYCSNELVARMDTDDVALPMRLSRQQKFMESNSDIAASSAILEEWDYKLERCLSVRKLPTAPVDLAKFALRRSPLSHPLAIFHKDIVLSVGGYPPLRKGQDYALWSLLLTKGYKLANSSEVLLKMRAGNEMLDRRGFSYFRHERDLLRFQKEIGFLTPLNYRFNYLIKFFLRLAPRPFRLLAYKFAR